MRKLLILAILLLLTIPAVGAELSDYEKRGLHLCSTEGMVDAVAKKDDFYTIIFLDVGPISFLRSEISEKRKRKLENLPLGRRILVLCIHPAFRDDWQKVYDSNKEVWPKLIDIEIVR